MPTLIVLKVDYKLAAILPNYEARQLIKQTKHETTST